jgi:hypothetical protein
MSNVESTVFVASIMIAVGIVGFVASLGWGKTTGRDMNRDTVLFLVKMWGGIVLFGLVLIFIM